MANETIKFLLNNHRTRYKLSQFSNCYLCNCTQRKITDSIKCHKGYVKVRPLSTVRNSLATKAWIFLLPNDFVVNTDALY